MSNQRIVDMGDLYEYEFPKCQVVWAEVGQSHDARAPGREGWA